MNSPWLTTLAALKLVVLPSHHDAIGQGPKGLQGRLCKDLYKTRADLLHLAMNNDHIRFTPQDRANLLNLRHASTSK